MVTDRFGTDFARELARLKRRGSAVLVRDDAHDLGICTDLLGSDEERRLRSLVRTTRDGSLPAPPNGAFVVHVATSDLPSPEGDGPNAIDEGAVVRRVDATEVIGGLATTVAEEVDRIVDSGVAPGELRVCLGRLDDHLARLDVEAVAVAVGDLTDLVREYAGMCHAHIAAEPPDGLELAFDVTVSARVDDGTPQHRWYLHAAGIDAGWLKQ